MIELHGWLTIFEVYSDEDKYSPDTLDNIMKEVKRIISACKVRMELQYMNGLPYINTSFASNHRTKEVDMIIDAYKSIVEIANGSYGIIYLRDDEDKMHHNDFLKIIFKKGCCIIQTDTDLSPCIPEIEEGIT